MRNWKVLTAVVVAVAVIGGGIGYTQWGNGSTKKKDLIVLADVQRRTLQDSVTLSGTLAREEQRKITAVGQGRVSAVTVKDGATAAEGDSLFSLDGRDAIAEVGNTRFFRPLTVGDRGDDVIQLKKILSAAGNNPGSVDSVFTEQTRFALAQWQAERHYPGATPVTPQSVTVALAQGAGYSLGAQTSAGLIIGPSGAQTAAATTGGVHRAVLAAYRPVMFAPSVDVSPAITPVLKIQSANALVPEGVPATFVISASAAGASDVQVNLFSGGTADSNDVVTPPASVTLLAHTTSVTVTVATRIDNVVKPKKTLTLSLAAGPGYSVGSPSQAETAIANTNVPEIHINGDTAVAPGGSVRLTLTADQAPTHDTQISLTFTGDALAGQDYRTLDPVVVMRAGQTTAGITVNTLTNNVIAPDHHIVVTMALSVTAYRIGSPGIAVITISGATGDAALPIVTLRSPTTHLVKGQPYGVTISLNEAITTALTVNLSYGGTAAQGTDFTLPGGNIVVPAGLTSLQVLVPTVQDKVVESDRVLTVSLAAAAKYRIGSPSSTSVTIQSAITPELTLTGATTTVAAGGAASFTIHADQAPVKDTSVNYQAIGTALPGKDFEPLLGTALLLAGQTEVTVTLHSIRSDVIFEPTDMIVGAWPIRVGQVFVKEGDPVPPGTPILSLTDPNFTVTLQASASDRTKLKLGQHCTVKLVGGTDKVAGTISELDANQTALAASTPGGARQNVYEGKIDVGDLGAADGASVSIDVVDQQRTNVNTVPIAAVKQNGSGQDVVRVIDLAQGGKVREVPVVTGLTEGSYIEVRKGLKGDETVIVEVDKPA